MANEKTTQSRTLVALTETSGSGQRSDSGKEKAQAKEGESMNEKTHLSLFSGIGGLDIAFHWAGFRTVGFCEWKDYQHGVMKKRFAGAVGWHDIRTLTGEDFYAKTGRRTVDVISGGFPCQPFSCAGQRRGTEDDRYLWPEMLRVINEIRPAFVVGENVAGLVSMGEPTGESRVESSTTGRYADTDYHEGIHTQQERMLLNGILEDLCQIGYQVQTFAIPACGVNAPHRRERIAIVGYAEYNGQFTASQL